MGAGWERQLFYQEWDGTGFFFFFYSGWDKFFSVGMGWDRSENPVLSHPLA